MKYSRGALGGVAGVGCRQVAVPKHTRPRLDAQCKARDCFHARQLANSGCRRSRACLASHAFGITQILGLYAPRPCAGGGFRFKFLAVRGGTPLRSRPASPRKTSQRPAMSRNASHHVHHAPRATHHAPRRESGIGMAGGRASDAGSQPPPQPQPAESRAPKDVATLKDGNCRSPCRCRQTSLPISKGNDKLFFFKIGLDFSRHALIMSLVVSWMVVRSPRIVCTITWPLQIRSYARCYVRRS